MQDNHTIPDPDETRLAALLRAVDTDVPPPDAALLASLRQHSIELFAESVGDIPADSQVTTGHSEPNVTLSQPIRRTRMLTLALRGTLALSTVVALLVAWLSPWNPQSVSGAMPFETVLAELRGALTLQLRVVKDGHSAEVWVRAPGLVRREESPLRYEIAAGSRLWRVDEATNTVTESDSPWFLNPQQQVDLLGLLDVGVKDASALLTARPVERALHDGRDCFVYRVNVPAETGRLQIEAFAEVRSHQLVGITARPAGARNTVNPPLAELVLIAMNVAVDDDKFVVAKSLTEDGRIGKVTDSQGIAVLRPMLAKRWTPLCRDLLLKPGDWLRTELRGANAVKVTLSSEVTITLGPGSLVECISPTKARLHSGEAQVTLPKKDGVEFELLAPRDGSRKFAAASKTLLRVDRNEQLVDVPQTPIWLTGFEGTTNNESLGSLIVNLPDGRNEPLTVGYHKVSVEIRDQIARTTIEESFVNHTLSRLEGVFHFPLPQDASISGFGMWIGNDLVEADVVEKQRAREIYETILRERRDPGLLEWTSGNLFKARVFPIEAQSEKRVKIVYTQVLPLRANRYRYSYGLRSDLLRTKPLRELSLTVTVNSALPLKSITCPTHTVRTTVGRPFRAVVGRDDGPEGPSYNSAQVEFTAQEYTPNRDFEVVCEIDGRQSDVVVVPHRRGDDGYFIVQLTPPAADGNWQRDVLPDGKPLSLVLLCDTSASMDSEKRKQQAEFVASVLSSLGADDRFLIAATDVGTAWPFAEPVVANAENIATAQKFLDDRLSLGWTNLDRAFDDVMKKTPADAHVIYIGDGIVSSGDTDPAAFVKRLGLRSRLAPRDESRTKGDAQIRNDASSKPNAVPENGIPVAERQGYVTFHAVTVGNTTEAVVLKGIASVGGGSVRTISGEQTPSTIARELLNEIAQPGLRDLNVEFRGLKVAAVYPGRLPNVPAGTQQILVGRYLPEGTDQQGEIIVTGRRVTEQVRYAARVSVKDAEAGNSFIPRLWARAHLDQLLAQGQSTSIRDQIIGMSEEFHIITPYTSLLVLETDADRERFGVKRRYEMRDGEKFFAEGRSNASFELLQQQMKRAGDWRVGLRRQVLQSLSGLGRNPQMFQQQVQQWDQSTYWYMKRSGDYNLPMSGVAAPMGGPRGEMGFAGRGLSFGGVGGAGFGGDVDRFDVETGEEWEMDGRLHRGLSEVAARIEPLSDSDDDLKLGIRAESAHPDAVEQQLGESLSVAFDSDFELLSEDAEQRGLLDKRAKFRGGDVLDRKSKAQKMDFGGLWSRGTAETFGRSRSGGPGLTAAGTTPYYGFANQRQLGYLSRSQQPNYTSWLNVVFPTLDGPPGKPAPALKDPEGWSPEALALSRSLLRMDALLKLEGGIELRRVSETFDTTWNRRSSHNSDLALYSPTAWLTRTLDADDHTVVSYCNAQDRGVFSLSMLLGRTRASVAQELKTPPLSLQDSSLSPLHESHRTHRARVEPAGENRAKLILSMKDSTFEQHFLIDTVRHVQLKYESFDAGKLTGSTTFEDFVEMAGSWWPRKSVTTDGRGRKIGEITFDVKRLTPDQYAQRMTAELAAKPNVQFLRLPFVSLKVARQNVADGSAGFDDRITMIVHNAMLQQWDDLLKHLDAAEKLAADKPGVRWIRTVALATIRRNEEARQRLLVEAKQLAANKQQDELHLAEFVLGQAYGISGWPEYQELVLILKPVYERQPAELDAMSRWNERLLSCHDGLGRHEDALALRRTMAEKAPWHLHWQIDSANRLLRAGQHDAAFAWLQKEFDRPIERLSHEDDSLRSAYADLYRSQVRWVDLLKFTTQWIARNPEYQSAYNQHLSALVFNDQLDAANALAEQWLKDARIEGKLSPALRARFDTALNFALGSSYHLSFQRADERWSVPLVETARFFLRSRNDATIAQRFINVHPFANDEEVDRLRGEFLNLLRTDLAKLNPVQINSLVSWTLGGRMEFAEPINGRKQLRADEVPLDIWRKIADSLRLRWKATEDREDKHLLGTTLTTIYTGWFDATESLPFLRERIAAAPDDLKPNYRDLLFNNLLNRPWTDELEQEAFQLLRLLSPPGEPDERLTAQLPALHRLTDSMLARRQERVEKELHDAGEVNKLTRPELAKKRAEMRKAARAGLATRLAAEAAKEQGPLAAWLKIEQAWLDVQLDQNLPQVAEQCWQILGKEPTKPVAEEDDDPDLTASQFRQQFFEDLLRERAFVTVMNLAARRNAAPATIDRLVKYIDAGIALRSPHAPREEPREEKGNNLRNDAEGKKLPEGAAARLAERDGYDPAAAWRTAKFQLLIALDRADDLDRELRVWIRTDTSTSPWRIMLARLVAERGKIDEAIQLFEACEKDKLLTAADYRLLADWYLVADRRAAYERSRIESFKQMPEHQLANSLYQVRNVWYRTDRPLPSELDENTLLGYRALFEKSANPENYLGYLRDLYAACRDFRLLQMLPDAILGRSPQQAYSFLQGLQTQVLYELRNEATADEILARIKQLRANGVASAPRLAPLNTNDRGADAAPLANALTPTDLRALDLLEALVERKSSEVLNQPGPHIDACLAAMRRAFERTWGEGEPRMMANFLYQLGGLPNEKLKTEQLLELRQLQKIVPVNTRDHLVITTDLCQLMFWNYSLKDNALREMEVAVGNYTRANNGVWPHLDNELLSHYVSMLGGANQHAAGETVVQKYLAKPENDAQRKWLHDRLMSLYNHALEHKGEVSLGKGTTLFQNLVALGLKELDAAADENVRYNLVSRLTTTLDIARRNKIDGVVEQVRKFAFETMPVVLKRQQSQYRNTVTTPMAVIAETLGPKFALQFVVERIEQYPKRLEIQWDNSWNVFGYELARRRHDATDAKLDIADLAPRVLKLALIELRRELRTGENRNRYIYHNDQSYFWAEKAADFARVANEVYLERRTSGRRVLHVALYLWHGLDLHPRAIEIMLLAHRDGVLEESSQELLVNWLHDERRFAESIPILEPLVSAHPDTIRYRTRLMAGYFHSQRPEQLLDLVKQTDTHFHDGGRWMEGNIAEFAKGCLGCNLLEHSVGYFNEAISLHQRNNPGHGPGDVTLSGLYHELAQAHSNLGQTRQAVEAASGAIICWGPRHDQRAGALAKLNQVLTESKDLAAYVQHLDQESAKTGQDRPILRKALGQVYQLRKEFPQAIAQFQLAVALQPNDKEVHQALIACYDATKNNDLATKQLLKLIDFDRHDLALYQQLAERLKDNEAEAERAATSIIEAAPNEAENHAALAELRQKQNRWDEAIPHWEQVAEQRRLEPTGLLKLAEAQLHQKQWDTARRSIEKLQRTEWPARFSDVANQTRRLQELLPK
ncbi:MAG: hypothetical protein HZA46_15090 [Planctomycetales bacterium]|nr:hypothetical protein [Planctomycetales bacterium]